MTKDEELAMDLALEALEYIHEGANNQGPHTGISWRCVAVKAEPAIKAIKQARALDKMAENARELGLDYEPAAPVQEPKFWYDQEEGLLHDHFDDSPFGCIPLYTTPPAAQRQWVEVEQIKWEGDKLIAKLKEKNT